MPRVTTHNFTIQEYTMRSLRQLFTSLVLVLMLSLIAFAGEITTGVAPPKPEPTPAEASGEITTGLAGDMHTPSSEGVSAGVAEAVLSLVQGVLSLL